MAMAISCTHPHAVLSSLAQPQHQVSDRSRSCCSSKSVAPRLGRRTNPARHGLVVRASGNLGDWGARDPFPEEVASDFGNKTLGNESTEHHILVPTLTVLSLSERAIKPLPEGAAPLTEAEAKALLRKVVGWRLVNLGSSEAGLKLQCDWILKDSDSVNELLARIARVADAENYQHDIQTLENNKVRVEVWTPSIGGLSENDFIFASKIDQVETKDLTRKIRTWF